MGGAMGSKMSFWEKPWAPFVMVPVLFVVLFCGLWLFFRVVPGPIQTRAEIKPAIEEFSVGETKIIDLKSGTEINRIIIPPNGNAVVERLIINTWGEQEVRKISQSR
jgi:hypothetical protein